MDSPTRNLSSGGAVPALKSPEKGPKRNTGKKAAPKRGKLIRGSGGKFAKKSNLATAMEEAESFLEESTEEAEEVLKNKKRAREDEDDEEMEKKIVAEADALAEKVAAKDISLKVLEKRRLKALDDVDRYNAKAGLVKSKLKGKAASDKSKEIKAKLSNLQKLLGVIRNLMVKRQDVIYAAALKEISEAKHGNKKRRTIASTLSEDSDGDGLDVSEDEEIDPDRIWDSVIDAVNGAGTEEASDEEEDDEEMMALEVDEEIAAALAVTP